MTKALFQSFALIACNVFVHAQARALVPTEDHQPHEDHPVTSILAEAKRSLARARTNTGGGYTASTGTN